MKRDRLNLSTREALMRQHKLSRDEYERDRIKTVLLRDKGWSPQRIAEALLIDRGTVRRHLLDYDNESKLKDARGGSSGKLTEEQTMELVSHLTGQLYSSNHEIVAHIKAKYGVSFTVSGLHNARF